MVDFLGGTRRLPMHLDAPNPLGCIAAGIATELVKRLLL